MLTHNDRSIAHLFIIEKALDLIHFQPRWCCRAHALSIGLFFWCIKMYRTSSAQVKPLPPSRVMVKVAMISLDENAGKLIRRLDAAPAHAGEETVFKMLGCVGRSTGEVVVSQE